MSAAKPARTWVATVGVGVALAALVAWSAWRRWVALSETPFPVGVDGYFYAIEVRSLLEHGALQYPASPLAFWLLTPFAAVLGPVAGVKLGAAVLGALVALPAYALGKRFGGGRGAGLFAAAIATTSAGSNYLTNEFVKNGIGLVVALTAVWLVLRALDPVEGEPRDAEAARRAGTRSRGRLSTVRIGLAGIAIGAAFLAHKMAAGLVVVVAVPAWLATAGARGRLRGRRLLYAMLACAVAALAIVVGGIVFPERFLGVRDVGLVADLFSTTAHWDAPALVTRRGSLALGSEAGIAAAVAILVVVHATTLGRAFDRWLPSALPRGAVDDAPPRVLPAGDAAAAWAFVGLAIVVGLPWLAVDDEQALGFRLRIAAFVPLAMVAALLVGRVLARVAHRETILGVLAVLFASRDPSTDRQGRILAHPAMVASVQALEGRIPDGDTVIVSERHILFMVAYYARARVSLRPERAPPERRWRLMPLAFVEAGSPLDELLLAARGTPGVAPPIGLHPRHPNGLVLVPEATWQWILARLPPGVPARWRDWQTI